MASSRGGKLQPISEWDGGASKSRLVRSQNHHHIHPMTTSQILIRRAVLVLAVSLLPSALQGQPSATMRPALVESLAVDVSSSSSEAVERGGVNHGEVAVFTSSVSVSGRCGINPTTSLVYGVAFLRHDLDAATPLLPDQLTELSLSVGLRRQFSPAWSGAAFLRPGYYGEKLAGESFNLPALAMATWVQSPTLTWNFGVNANAFAEYPVLPIAGVRWQFARDWTFNVGFPQSGFSWRAREGVTLRAGVGFNGGSFRVSEERGSPAAGIGRLTNTFVDFREVRVGAGADIALGDGLMLTVSAGVFTDRKFDYFDRDFVLDGEGGLYGAVGVRSTF